MDTHHVRFSVIDTEEGTISPSQLATLTGASLLLNDIDEGTDVFMTPADEPILICSLPQPVPVPVMEASPPEIKHVKKGGGSRRKSKRIQLRSSPDSDEGTDAGPAAKATLPPASSRMLPATLREAKRKEIAMDPIGKVGSCAENPTPAGRSPVKEEKDKDPSGKAGSCGGNPSPAVQIPIKKEVEDSSRKAPPCSESYKEKNPLDAVYGSSTSNPLPPAAMNFLDALKLLSKPLDNKYEDADILDICAMKGIHFDPPRWHRPGGYDRKTDKDAN